MKGLYDGFEDVTPNSGAQMFGQSTASISVNNFDNHVGLTTGMSNMGQARPMTSNKAAGYVSSKTVKSLNSLHGRNESNLNKFMSDSGPAPELVEKSSNGPFYKAQEMENDVTNLLEQSIIDCSLYFNNNISNNNNNNNKHDLLSNALDKAKQARKKERELVKYRMSNDLTDSINYDLTVGVLFNLGYVYECNGLYNEALNSYQTIIKNKSQYTHATRLRVNMGNIYFKMAQYSQAIKMYQMAIDEIGNNVNQHLRLNIMNNIGNSLIKLGQFSEAIQCYENIMENVNSAIMDYNNNNNNKKNENGNNNNNNNNNNSNKNNGLCYHLVGMPPPVTVFNLLVCYYALGDKEKMKKTFVQLLNVEMITDDNNDDNDKNDNNNSIDTNNTNGSMDKNDNNNVNGSNETNNDFKNDENDKSENSKSDDLIGLNKNRDDLSMYIDSKWFNFGKYVKMGAQLIAPVIGSNDDIFSGFDWIVQHLENKSDNSNDELRGTFDDNDDLLLFNKNRHYQQLLQRVSLEISVAKGIAYLKAKKVNEAIDVFKSLQSRSDDNKDSKYNKYHKYNKHNKNRNVKAATNLSFIYFVESSFDKAKEYSDLAVMYDRYNANALVNRANCLFMMNEFLEAKEMYLEAIGVEADCIEAIFNLGLVCKKLQHYNDSLQAFKKLHKIDSKSIEVIYHIGNIYQLLNDMDNAIEWYKMIQGMLPTDPSILTKLGNLYRCQSDETQCFHNYLDSFKCYPCDLEVISWLGVWYVNSELYEQAIFYFEKASQIDKTQVKWQLMVASCYRRMRHYNDAIDIYQNILTQWSIYPNKSDNDSDIHSINNRSNKRSKTDFSRLQLSDNDIMKCLDYLCVIMKEIDHSDYPFYHSKLLSMQNENKHISNSTTTTNNTKNGTNANSNSVNHTGRAPNSNNDNINNKNNNNNNNNGNNDSKNDNGNDNRNNNKEDDDWGDDDLNEQLLPS